MKKLMIGIFAAIGLAHVACGTTVANSAEETGYEDASRGFWPDYSEYKILRYVVGQIGRADFRDGLSGEVYTLKSGLGSVDWKVEE
jgi:hypothetical protein